MLAVELGEHGHERRHEVALGLVAGAAAVDQFHHADRVTMPRIDDQVVAEQDTVGLQELGKVRLRALDVALVESHVLAQLFRRDHVVDADFPLLREHGDGAAREQELVDLVAVVLRNRDAWREDDQGRDIGGNRLARIDARDRVALLGEQAVADARVGLVDGLRNLLRGLGDLLHHRVVLDHRRHLRLDQRIALLEGTELQVSANEADLPLTGAVDQRRVALLDLAADLIEHLHQLRCGGLGRHFLRPLVAHVAPQLREEVVELSR